MKKFQIVHCLLVFLVAIHSFYLQSSWIDWRGGASGMAWVCLLLTWLAIFFKGKKLQISSVLFPVVLLFLSVADHQSWALKLTFRFQKSQLERLARGPEFNRRELRFSPENRSPLAVEKQGEAVRILLHERLLFVSAQSFGFARCPGSCELISFTPVFHDAAAKPEYREMEDGWFAVRLKGSYF